MDFLARTIGSLTGSNIPFNIGEPIRADEDFPSIWNVYRGTKKSDNAPCTLFIFDSSKARMKDSIVLAKNMASKLKKLRIPGVLKIIDSVETDTSIIIAVEPSQPLYVVSNDLNSDTKLWGLGHILRTLGHIHKEAKCIHGNINLGSVFMTDAGEWALGGLELCTSISENVSDGAVDNKVTALADLLPGATLRSTPESARSGGSSFQKPSFALDSWQFGTLVNHVFNGFGSSGASRGKVPIPLWNLTKKNLLAETPQQRIPLARIVQNPAAMKVFKTDIDDISEPLKTISMATDYQFSEFLDTFNRVAPNLPQEYLINTVAPELCKCVGLNKGGIKGISTVLSLSNSFPPADHSRLITPLIVQLFASPDRAVRMELLTNLPNYVEKLDSNVVAGQIYPSLSQGFSDTEPSIREQTVKSVVLIIDKLTDRIVNGELLRLLAKTQSDAVPEIRANTTILLGKIANKFSASTRSGVLVAAYARALKDPFVSSRIAALMALSATSEYFSPQECAAKLVGALAPSLLDSDRSVRVQATVTMDILMKKITAQAEKLDSEGTSGAASVSRTNTPNGSSVGVASDWTSRIWGAASTKLSDSGGPDRTNSGPPAQQTLPQQVLLSSHSGPVTPAIDDLDNDASWGELVDDLEDFGWDDHPEEKKSPTVMKPSAPAKKSKGLKLNGPKASKLVLEDTTGDDSAAWGWD